MPPLFPGPAYRIVTPRLVIRCYQPSDAPLLQEASNASKEHLMPFMPWAYDLPASLETELALVRRFRGNFDLGIDFVYGIFNPEETRVLGGTGLHTRVGSDAREIGYWIHVDFAGQGLATEVSAALTRVAFEVDAVNRVEIHCDPANTRSANVARKLGYTHEATLRKRLARQDGSARDAMIWTLLREEYPDSPSASASLEVFDAMGRKIL